MKVGVATSVSNAAVALAAYSRWCNFSAELPDPTKNEAEFAASLLQLLDQHPSNVVMPAHDGSIEVLRRYRAEFEKRAALPLASEQALEIAVNKQKTLAVAEGLGIATPRRAALDCEADVVDAVREIGLPAVLKPNRSWAAHAGGGIRLASLLVQTVDEVKAECHYLEGLGATATLQGWLPGGRDAVSFFVGGGEVRARFAQTSYRELPPLGGASVLCESIPLLDDIAGPAERLVQTIGLEGCSMVEFRRDAKGKPVLMELNPRMAGSVNLAVRCGVDFPSMTYAWAMGKPLSNISSYAVGKRIRWLVGDFWNLKYSFDSPRGPDTPGRLRAVTRFLADFVRRPAALDPFDWTDPVPSLVEMHIYVLARIAGRIARFGRNPVPALMPITPHWVWGLLAYDHLS
ncbi:MAG TPA: ATP-grasp domain-containing protein [Dehalococcoidia bacterium]|nr:ATP-grasp domain-containing protein [Dehalococcoidia bacterium]